VRIRTASGLEGVGYTYTVGAGGKAIQVLLNHDIRPVLLGVDARSIAGLWQDMWHRLQWVGRGGIVVLMVDANMQWRVDQAIRAAQALKEFDVLWLEEPIAPDDVAGHVRVSREGGLPIAAGENLHTVYEFQSYISHGCLDFPEPDLSNMGGITAWMQVAKMAQAHNLPVTSHGVHDLHVHLLAAAPNGIYLEVHGFSLDRFIAQPLQIENGEAVAPERPGHGVNFNWQALAEHEVQP
jgi:L-alanine-DL-glutamate epimerase-like enolase superfamily enzyme